MESAISLNYAASAAKCAAQDADTKPIYRQVIPQTEQHRQDRAGDHCGKDPAPVNLAGEQHGAH